MGLCDAPPPEPEEFVLVLDGSPGSTASLASVEPVLTAVLERAIGRPGSIIKVWTVGTGPSDCRELGAVEVPEPPRRLRNPRAHRTELTASLRDQLVPLIAAALEAAGKQTRSAISDALTLAARSRRLPGRSRHWVVVVSDLREMTGRGGLDLECRRALPSDADIARNLEARGLLQPGTLDGFDVRLVSAPLPPFPGRPRCNLSLRRGDDLARLWTVALRHAGAHRVDVDHGALRFDASTTGTN